MKYLSFAGGDTAGYDDKTMVLMTIAMMTIEFMTMAMRKTMTSHHHIIDEVSELCRGRRGWRRAVHF